MKTFEQNRKNKRTEIERFDWFAQRIQTRVGFGWLSERSTEKTSINQSRNQSILRLDVILQHDWPIEQCLLHIGVFFSGKTKRPCLHLFIHWLIKQITNTYRNHFSRSYANRSKFPVNRAKITNGFVWTKQPVKFFSLSKIRQVMSCEGNLSHLTGRMTSAKKKSAFFPWLPFIETIFYLICIFYLLGSNGLPMNNEGNLAEEVEPENKFSNSLLLQPIFQNWAKNKKDLFHP